MTGIIPLVLALVPTTCIVTAWFLWEKTSKFIVKRRSLSPTAALLAILDPPGATLQQLLRARAHPNARLQRAFDLHNPFVSGDATVRQSFIRDARRIIKIPMAVVQDTAYTAARDTMSSMLCSSLDGLIDYADSVQVVVLRTVLTLLDADVSAAETSDLLVVAHGINDLWEHSKTSTAMSPKDIATRTTINTLLSRWLPPNTGFIVPLDIIIPTWETLWRVVGISLAYATSNQVWHDTFTALVDNPDRVVFSGTLCAGGVSAEAVIKEVLRVHPPTKRIAREIRVQHAIIKTMPEWLGQVLQSLLPATFASYMTIVKADVEAAHQDPRVWGEDADTFNPQRFMNNYHPKIYAFGYGRMECIAKDWAPAAAAFIVSSILHATKDFELEIVRGKVIGGRVGWDGWVFRKAHCE